MAAKNVHSFPCGNIPDAGRLIFAAGGDNEFSIRREGSIINAASVPGEDLHGFAAGNIPQEGGVIRAASRQEVFAVWREFDPIDLTRMPEKMRMVSPVATSQSRAVLSLLPVAKYFPSGEKSTPHTSDVCPLNSSGEVSTVGEETTVGGSGVNVGMGADVTTGVASTCGVQAVSKTTAINRMGNSFFVTMVIFLIGRYSIKSALFGIKHKRCNHRRNCFHTFIPLSAAAHVDSNRDIPVGSILTKIQEVVALGIAVFRAPEDSVTERRSSNQSWKRRVAITERTGMGPIFAHPYINHIAL